MVRKNILMIRIVLWLILAVAVGWFGYMKIIPSGKVSYVYDFSRPNYFIGKLAPEERVKINKTEAEIKGDPVYFSLKTPRRFEQAKVTVRFKNTTDFPIMEIGLLNNKDAWSYDLKPLQNKIIDQLSLAWPVAPGENGARLIERKKKYNTVEQFLGNLPDMNEIALYNYNFKNHFLLNNYEFSQKNNLIDYKFRGSYQFYTYIKQEELNYVFNFVDLNLNLDNDSIEIKVYSNGSEIYSAYVVDKKVDNDERQAIIKIAGLPEAVYRFSVIANDDVITKSIISKQSQFVLINKIWLAESNKESLTLFTNSRLISAQTVNPASLGKIKVGDTFLDLNETYKQLSVKTLNQPVKVELNKDDIIISGDGVFSFTESGLFDPRFKNVDGNLDINGEKINYILTNYQTPANSDDWQTAIAEFDLTKAYQENGKYQFLISVPCLKAEKLTQGEIIIKEIKVDLSGTALLQKFKKYFNR
ncbi:hypothetical protein KJ627_02050 [Patescibacteria group bacterium]|nr:hypothetical protein [Patescibacteria group bacterium]MBU1663414.1 hypothetical protein [Patescibacteria group bacterium]MBU2007700.1 hypothetical protein [Patescibacteria group bacterium]MBU2233622.1 hypothetical protein [Patescibacteria group bacterium]MBU2264337.1 hypothetical protein [Patescibacteria group bacterium]